MPTTRVQPPPVAYHIIGTYRMIYLEGHTIAGHITVDIVDSIC